MGYRLSKIYTRTGDNGTTGLGNGQRVDKDSDRIEAIGTVDELNSLIGVLLAQGLPAGISELLVRIQHQLFDLGGELSIPSLEVIGDQAVADLEHELDRLNEDLPPLKEFILPGGSLSAASCHHARTLCRRAERRVLHLARLEGEQVSDNALKYLNRLSDLLFVMARTLARLDGGSEVFWSKQH